MLIFALRHCFTLRFITVHRSMDLFFVFFCFVVINLLIVTSRPRTPVDVMFLLILFEYVLGVLVELLMLVEPQVGQND